jgi:phosphoribosylanthranilate isomerase
MQPVNENAMSVAVKICGITRAEDGVAAACAGAHAIGLVFYAPSPRNLDVAQALQITRALPPFVTAVALFVDPDPERVREVVAQVPVSLLQFHGDETPEFCRTFGLPYIKAAHVKPGRDLLQYVNRYSDARGMLFDAYVSGYYGGTGEAFDWSALPRDLPLPTILSGGLTPENVARAIRQVRPWAVDVSSGVESAKGIKDAAKIAAFMQGVRSADV